MGGTSRGTRCGNAMAVTAVARDVKLTHPSLPGRARVAIAKRYVEKKRRNA